MDEPITVESPSTAKFGRRVHQIHRDKASIPEEAYDRIGREKPFA